MNKSSQNQSQPQSSLRHRIHEIIFEADTRLGLLFDVLLLIAILLSVIVVCLETVESIKADYGKLFITLEWVFTILFTIEYVLRLYCVKRPVKYATSFFGVIDLLAILPLYLTLMFSTGASFAVVRAFRLLRVFRIFKLLHFMKESNELGRAIMRARNKIIVFIGVVIVAITVAGALMYEIENWGQGGKIVFETDEARFAHMADLKARLNNAVASEDFENANSLLADIANMDPERKRSKFRNIPESMYWATVTMTTVGYGDIVPMTTLGKFVAAILILLGYSLIIVPTGFVSAEFIEAKRAPPSTQACPYCMLESHDIDAVHCKQCGKPLNEDN